MATRYFCLLAFLLLSFSSQAQTSDKTGIFYLTNIEYKLNGRWSAYLENQWRSLNGFRKFYYYELKGGVTYKINKNYSVTLGTGVYETFADGDGFEGHTRQAENRIWEQFNMDHNLSIVEIEHRYRVEQRFKSKYENRFRYRLKADVPINSRKIEPKTLFASVFNELFFTDVAPNFSRNRFQAGAGYQFTETMSLNAGWLRQVDFSKTSTRKKNYIYTAISIDI